MLPLHSVASPTRYRLYGLSVGVDAGLTVLLSGVLAEHTTTVPADLRLGLHQQPAPQPKSLADWPLWWISDHPGIAGTPEFHVYRHASGAVRMVYDDGVAFTMDAAGTQVEVGLPDGFDDLPSLLPALLGPVLGVVLRLRGTVCLHASAVVIGGRAVGLVGVSGAGKSTTAAALALRGHPVLTDDVLALDDHGAAGGFAVRPAYPRLRLWPASARGLLGSEDLLPRMMPGVDKRILSLDGGRASFQPAPAPLAALYFLQDRAEGGLRPVEAARPAEALMRLIGDSYASRFLDARRRGEEFDLLGRLVQQVPLREVHAPDDLGQLNAFVDQIVDDFRTQVVRAGTAEGCGHGAA